MSLLPGALGAGLPIARREIQYQGCLLEPDGSPVPDSVWSVTFRFWDRPVGGSVLWSETQGIRVTEGTYWVFLGQHTPLDLPFEEKPWLGVQAEGRPEQPRVLMDFAAYTYNADMVDGYHAYQSYGWTGSGYHDGLARRTLFRVVGDRGPAELYVPFVHWWPFRLVVTCAHAAPRTGDVAYVECVENDDVLSCVGIDGSGAQVRTEVSLSSNEPFLSVRSGHVTVSCAGDGSRRFRIHTQGEWVLGYLLF